MEIVWAAAFLDVAAAEFDAAATFWTGVTGGELGDATGERGEYASIVRPDEDPAVWLQRTDRAPGAAGCHFDLMVADLATARAEATALGAVVQQQTSEDVLVLATPAGQPFCLVAGKTYRRVPQPVAWPGGHLSLVDQICFDIPPEDYDRDAAFWAELTGWERRAIAELPEFERLVRPAGQPLRILLQRMADPASIRAHLDLACDDRAAEIARHRSLGARVLHQTDGWTTMQDPIGLHYCITRRVPGR